MENSNLENSKQTKQSAREACIFMMNIVHVPALIATKPLHHFETWVNMQRANTIPLY